jgi:hypothetical protein
MLLQDPFRAAEMSLEIQVERLRVAEALIARDNVVHRLTEAYVSIRQKTAAIEQLQREKETLLINAHASSYNSKLPTTHDEKKSDDEVIRLEGVIKKLEDEIRLLKQNAGESTKFVGDPPPRYEEGKPSVSKVRYSLLFLT